MPTTPPPTDHPDSSERKESAITTNNADTHPDHGDEPADPPYRDDARCPCGALAERNGPCHKCRARATWERRQANRGRRFIPSSSQRPASSRRAGRSSSRPRGRRPGR